MIWDLSVLFKNNDDLENFSRQICEEAEKFECDFAGKFATLSASEFEQCVRRYEQICEGLGRVMTFVYLTFSKDTTQGAFLARYEEETNKAAQKLLFFELEFNELDEAKRAEFSKSERYGYYLKNVAKEKPFQLSKKEESVLLKVSNVGVSAWGRFFDETMSRMEFDFRGEKLGEEEVLAKLSDADRSVRRDAAQSLTDGLKANLHPLTFVMNMVKSDLKNDCDLRGYEFSESARHLDNQISKKSVDALVEAVEANFSIAHEYYAKKGEVLGLGELFDYDRYAPLGEEEERLTYEEAKGLVLEAFGEFSEEFASIARSAFDEGWVDVMPQKNKRGGAFSHSSVSGTHPFILLNYTNKRKDAFTLAHEMGHTIHQFLSYKVGYLNADTPLVTAETASVFCEMLLFEYLKKRTKNVRGLLAGKIEDILATLFRQINFTTFERKVHAKEGELSSEELSQIWFSENEKMFGKTLTLTENYKLWWSYIPHFIHSPFYCYAYSYAQLLVLALFGLYKSGRCENFVELYTEFLSSGGSKSPAELVLKFGFDLEDSEFWQIGLAQVAGLVEEFKRL